MSFSANFTAKSRQPFSGSVGSATHSKSEGSGGSDARHVAIIMDGNGRWATRQGKKRLFGHQNAIQSVKEAVESCAELGIPYLTLYAFSTENWNRPTEEVAGMMKLIVSTIDGELTTLSKHDIHLRCVGDLQRMPAECQKAIQKACDATKKNKGLHLTIALSYSGQWDIVEASKAIAKKVRQGLIKPEDINTEIFRKHLATQAIPSIDLLVRTSGEQRVSNFA